MVECPDMKIETKEGEQFEFRNGGSDVIASDEDLSLLAETLVKETFEPSEFDEYFPGKLAEFKELIKQPEASLLFDGEKLIGIGKSVLQREGTQAQKPIVEIKRVTVSPNYQGKGLGSILTLQLHQDILSKHPKGVIFSIISRHEKAKSVLNHGYRQISHEEYFEMLGRPNDPEIQGLKDANMMIYIMGEENSPNVSKVQSAIVGKVDDVMSE